VGTPPLFLPGSEKDGNAQGLKPNVILLGVLRHG